ncbi:hypothetical protein [Nocardioides iriomotensis]|nr:hypothetical protein [Nocardioides iriomotensis]
MAVLPAPHQFQLYVGQLHVGPHEIDAALPHQPEGAHSDRVRR